MSKLMVTTFVTLDDVYQAPGGPDEDRSGGFEQGGWLEPHFDAAGGAFMGDVFSRAGSFLLGRKTYEIFAGYWLLVFPVVLGAGKRLFPEGITPAGLRRTNSRATEKGVVILSYSPMTPNSAINLPSPHDLRELKPNYRRRTSHVTRPRPILLHLARRFRHRRRSESRRTVRPRRGEAA